MTDVLNAKLDEITGGIVERAIAQRDKVGRPKPKNRCTECGAQYRHNRGCSMNGLVKG